MNANNDRFGCTGDHVLDKAFNPQILADTSHIPEWPAEKPVGLPRPFPTLSHWVQEFRHRLDYYGAAEDLSETADVVIIGSGLTGCSAALHTIEKDPSLKVVMLEARAFCSGSTGRNGGHLARPDGFDFRADYNALGGEKFLQARTFFQANTAAMLDYVRKNDLAKQVDLTWTGGVQIFGSVEERECVIEDLKFMASCGLKNNTKVLDKDELSKAFECENLYGGMISPDSGTIWPRKFCAALTEDAMKRSPENFKLFTSARVESIDAANDSPYKWQVNTKRGSVKARAVLHATNAWLCGLLPEFLGTTNQVIPDKEMMVAVRPSPAAGSAGPWKHNVMATNGFHYLAQMPKREDDPRENVIIYGLCEEHNNSDDTTLIENSETGLDAMTTFLGQAFPKKFTELDDAGRVTPNAFENVWSGLIGRTVDGRAIVGPVKDKKGQFVAAGYNGAGMSRCFLTGKCISDMMVWQLSHEKEKGEASAAWQTPDYFPPWFLSHIDEL